MSVILAVAIIAVADPAARAVPPGHSGSGNGGRYCLPVAIVVSSVDPACSATSTTRQTAAPGPPDTFARRAANRSCARSLTPRRAAGPPRRRELSRHRCRAAAIVVSGADPGALRRQRNAPNCGAGPRAQSRFRRRAAPRGHRGGEQRNLPAILSLRQSGGLTVRNLQNINRRLNCSCRFSLTCTDWLPWAVVTWPKAASL
jgi:hypothetical protein